MAAGSIDEVIREILRDMDAVADVPCADKYCGDCDGKCARKWCGGYKPGSSKARESL